MSTAQIPPRKEKRFQNGKRKEKRMRKRFKYPWHIWNKKTEEKAAKTPKEPEESTEVFPPQRAPLTEQVADILAKRGKNKLPHGNRRNLESRITIKGDIAEIKSYAGPIAIIDAEDIPKVRDYPWCATTGNYFHAYKRGSGGKKRITYSLHRLIMDAAPGSIVDHIDGDPTNNCKSNLRFATASGNACNRRKNKSKSLPKGVRWDAHAQAYIAKIGKDHTSYCLKHYATIEEAATAYNMAAIALHGDFASLNDAPNKIDIKRRANKYSPYKGANWNPKYRKWYGQISLNGRCTYLGRFQTDLEAAKAYDKAAKDIFGAGAVLNFPDSEPVQEGPLFFLRKFNSQRTKKTPPEINLPDLSKVEH